MFQHGLCLLHCNEPQHRPVSQTASWIPMPKYCPCRPWCSSCPWSMPTRGPVGLEQISTTAAGVATDGSGSRPGLLSIAPSIEKSNNGALKLDDIAARTKFEPKLSEWLCALCEIELIWENICLRRQGYSRYFQITEISCIKNLSYERTQN